MRESDLYLALAHDAGEIEKAVQTMIGQVEQFPEHDHRRKSLDSLREASRSLLSTKGHGLHAAGMRCPPSEEWPDREVECMCANCKARRAATNGDAAVSLAGEPAKTTPEWNLYTAGEQVEFRLSAVDSFNLRGTIVDDDFGGTVLRVRQSGVSSPYTIARSNVRKLPVQKPSPAPATLDR